MRRLLPFLLAGAAAVLAAGALGAPWWLAVPCGYAAMLASAFAADRHARARDPRRRR